MKRFAEVLAIAVLGILMALATVSCAPRKNVPQKMASSAVSSQPSYAEQIDAAFAQKYPHDDFAAKYEAAKKENSDTIGWLYVPGTTINLAVTHYTDNNYYLKHGLNKQYKWKGNPFLDHRDTLDPMMRNLIVYGHNMGDGDLFGQLKKYESLSFLQQHPVVYFSDGEQGHYWKIFAVFITDLNFYYIQTDFKDDADFGNLLGKFKARSFFNAPFDVTASDKILTFSTCTYEFKNARFVVAARLLHTDEQEPLFDAKPYTENKNALNAHGK